MTPTKNTPPDTLHRVFRGGSWYFYEPSWVRAASRGTIVPASRYDGIGFRTSLPVRQSR
jgi:formylglycine-generating enzyme required for sulfatase activity